MNELQSINIWPFIGQVYFTHDVYHIDYKLTKYMPWCFAFLYLFSSSCTILQRFIEYIQYI